MQLVYSLERRKQAASQFVIQRRTKMNRAIQALLAILALCLPAFAPSPEESPAARQQAAPQAPSAALASAPAARPDDVKSINSILTALYGVISGPAGERDWDRFRSLFLPQARLTSATKNADGSSRIRPMGVEDYAKAASNYFLQHAFYESPVVNRIETFGNITQIFSSYESRHAPGEAPFARGINSIQMLNDSSRWWIVSILWDEERADNPLPKEFAGKSSGTQK